MSIEETIPIIYWGVFLSPEHIISFIFTLSYFFLITGAKIELEWLNDLPQIPSLKIVTSEIQTKFCLPPKPLFTAKYLQLS